MSQRAPANVISSVAAPTVAVSAAPAVAPTIASVPLDANARLLQQRNDFKIAWRAASRGDMVTLAPYLETLKDYPLYPYLRYAYLEATLDKQPDELVEQWLDENHALPIAAELRQEWVISLAHRQDWDAVLANERYEVTLAQRCAVVSAHVLGGNSVNSWSAAAQRLWLVPNVPLTVCQPLFDYLDAHGLITAEMRRQRVDTALLDRDFVTAAALAPTLDVADRTWAERWLSMAANPAAALRGVQVPDEPRYQEMLLAGVKLLARNDPDQALQRWAELSQRYHFNHAEARDMRTLLAMQQAWHLTPDALTDLKSVHDSVDPQIPEWRARLALRAGNWNEALKDISALGWQSHETEWRYWRARALEQLGQKNAAHALYRQLAKTPDYYGFLSADRLDLDYRIVEQASRPSDGTIDRLESQPGFIRARELVYAGLYPQADAEWALATRTLSTASRCQAALMAQRWGWYARVIPALTSGGCWQDLSLIYPIAFQDTLAPAAKHLALDLSWIYGLIRQESVFKPNAVSHVGALGLMQLMPDTGKKVSARIGLTLDSPRALLDPHTNLTVGSNYLSSLLQHFSGSEPLATAAYNAGEERVQDWRPGTGALAADVWIDTIPYTETRHYVQKVMTHTVMFDWRLNGKPERLSDRIGQVTADTAVTAPAAATVVTAKVSILKPR
ncbi:MAG TPA: transglycosylase SLT domain-containing protein [Gammaproteobacteria bacterium]